MKPPSTLLKYCYAILIMTAFIIIDIHSAKAIEPIFRIVGKLKVSIDPRQELLSVVELLTRWQVVDTATAYSQDIYKYYSKYSDNPIVDSVCNKLFEPNLSRGELVSAMLSLSDFPENTKIGQLDDIITGNPKFDENKFIEFITLLSEFAKVTNFSDYWESKTKYYNKILDLSVEGMQGKDYITSIENYFGDSKSSYNIIICPSNIGNYSVSLKQTNGNIDIYSCNMPTGYKDSIPLIDLQSINDIVLHEFCHSFTSLTPEQYIEHIKSSENLYEPNQKYLQLNHPYYQSWDSYVYEYINRAATLRLIEINFDSKEARICTREEINTGWIYMQAIVDKLKNYERARQITKISFSDYFPNIISVFDSLSKSDISKYLLEKDSIYSGPIFGTTDTNICVIYPTNDPDKNAQAKLLEYINFVCNRIFVKQNRQFTLLADTSALQVDLSKNTMMIYGTISSNLFLYKYKDKFPFKIDENSIYADKVYNQSGIKLITCFPNPMNPKYGMLIYTSTNNTNIIGINRIRSKNADFAIYDNLQSRIGHGFYRKNNREWTYETDNN